MWVAGVFLYSELVPEVLSVWNGTDWLVCLHKARKDPGCCCCPDRLCFSDLVRLGKGTGMAGAGGGELEGLNGEGEVLIVGVIHKEPEKSIFITVYYIFLPFLFPESRRFFKLYVQCVVRCRDSNPRSTDCSQLCYHWATHIPAELHTFPIVKWAIPSIVLQEK